MHEVNGQLRRLRGEIVILTVDPTALADHILHLAVQKHAACNCMFSANDTYKLLYPDGQPVIRIPGTTDLFTLPDYRSFIGKSYQKLILFICNEVDYAEGKQTLCSYLYTCIMGLGGSGWISGA